MNNSQLAPSKTNDEPGTKGPQETDCPYCGFASFFLISSTDRNRRTTNRIFIYQKCPQCGLIFMKSPPHDMGPFYRGGYDEIPLTLAELRTAAKRELYRLEPILKYKSGGRFLEIGPWRGAFSCNMKDAGFEVTAIEMNSECIRFLRDTVGIEAIQSTDPAEAMKALRPGFDVIAAWHSLEHLPNPWRVVQNAWSLLSPGGLLVLAMPNPDSFEFSMLKGKWMHLDAPRHLYFYPIKTLCDLCDKAGFDLVEFTTSDEFSKIQSRHAWRHWVASWIPIRYVRGAVSIVLGRLLFWWAYGRQMKEGQGSAYTAVFMRR